MNIAFFSTLPVEKIWFNAFSGSHQITYISQNLDLQTADLANGHRAVCAFANDDLSRPVLQRLKKLGVAVVGMRCMGLENVDQEAMADLGITLLHIPGQSPYSVAEMAVTLLLGMMRHLPLSSQQTRMGDFTLDELLGSDLHGKTVGIIGVGRIGRVFARIMLGFGCKVIAYDLRPDPMLMAEGVQYRLFSDLLHQADILSLHCPLTPLTTHLIDAQSLSALKPTAIVVNTARGGLVDTEAILNALDAGQLAGYATDVYEEEKHFFYQDYSQKRISDALLNRLRSHPNVLLTPHQAFLTEEALRQMARNLLNQFAYFDSQQTTMITRASMC